jgi:hypothetical protein
MAVPVRFLQRTWNQFLHRHNKLAINSDNTKIKKSQPAGFEKKSVEPSQVSIGFISFRRREPAEKRTVSYDRSCCRLPLPRIRLTAWAIF